MTETELPETHTMAWNIQVWAAFAVAVGMTLIGVYQVPGDLWVRGYLSMGVLFSIGSTFTLAKTVRDNLEAQKLRNRVRTARTEKLLHEFEDAA